jgi:ribulose-5-phosphate 4-epimerase/fuculose-1-phosphate aldolase
LLRSKPPAIITAEDVMAFDLDSDPVDRQSRLMHTERDIHGDIYIARQDRNAIVHSHSPGVISESG